MGIIQCFISFISQPGYHVKAVGPHSFSCQKLSQISVRIFSKEDGEELFPSVLLSLSGEDGYRNNSVAGAGGNFLFDSLFPGSFYLRPLLKVASNTLPIITSVYLSSVSTVLVSPQIFVCLTIEAALDQKVNKSNL